MIPIRVNLLKFYLAYHKISNEGQYHMTMIERLFEFVNKLANPNSEEAIQEFMKSEESLLQFYNVCYDST